MDSLIQAALDVAGNTHSVEEVKACIARGDAKAWLGERSVVVVDFFVTPRVKAINFWLVGGDLRELLRMLPDIESWAKAHGYTHALGAGRSAWGRALRRHGFLPTHTLFEKEL